MNRFTILMLFLSVFSGCKTTTNMTDNQHDNSGIAIVNIYSQTESVKGKVQIIK